MSIFFVIIPIYRKLNLLPMSVICWTCCMRFGCGSSLLSLFFANMGLVHLHDRVRFEVLFSCCPCSLARVCRYREEAVITSGIRGDKALSLLLPWSAADLPWIAVRRYSFLPDQTSPLPRCGGSLLITQLTRSCWHRLAIQLPTISSKDPSPSYTLRHPLGCC